ncbi:MAG: AtpZ/AtpI family protein [Armatimonadetes bacterium]|nr:AtpZ/AtpI family protein [Armatimonadota bacterium]
MNDEPGRHKEDASFTDVVARKQERKLWARRHRQESLWFGLGMFGLVGWSVSIPTLMGIAIGLWLDSRFPSRFSWTLMLLAGGLMVGCMNAWYWISREREIIERSREDEDRGDDGHDLDD